MKKKNYSTEEELTSAITGCATADDASNVIGKAKADTGDFAYLNIRYVITHLDEASRARMLSLFLEADPRFSEFAGPGCDK